MVLRNHKDWDADHEKDEWRTIGNMCSAGGIVQLRIPCCGPIARESIFVTSALICKEPWRIISSKVYVVKHCASAVICQVIKFCSKGTGKLLECIATGSWQISWSFALASDDGVVLEFEVDRAICKQEGKAKHNWRGNRDHVYVVRLFSCAKLSMQLYSSWTERKEE